jgi:hypothetical protein
VYNIPYMSQSCVNNDTVQLTMTSERRSVGTLLS